jgi:drug/metabolite transporter (DMT)-like permease
MGELAALSASAVWAVASLMFTRLSKDHGPLVMNYLKCVIAVVFMMLTLSILEGRAWPVDMSSTNIAFLAASGIVGLTIGDTAFFNALTRIGARRALLLMALSPPTTALLAVPFLGEPITLRLAAGMLLTLGGVVWVILERTTPADTESEDSYRKADDRRTLLFGVGFALVAMLCQSAGNILTKLGGDLDSPLAISVVRLTFGIAGLLVVVAVSGRLAATLEPFKRGRTAAILVVATFLGTYLGIWLLNAGLKYSYAGIAATLSSTSPIFVLPLAYFVQKEKLSFRSIAGAFVAVSGVAIIFVL